ncbi:DUF5675 family protein [Halodesulfovibrio aestuarii]|uniref:DUF5675 family protein n=1 Tax=Halodesulfovibrio aestuarii TaxID=126333 RepID=A0ABV4JWW1_9BACT
MRRVTLTRTATGDHGTFGKLATAGFACFTCEPPNKDNRPNVSCIPAGEYLCKWHHSPRFGMVCIVTGVPDRTAILIHSGNVGGDIEKGLRTHTHGCILLGKHRGVIQRQQAVCLSRPTCRKFFNHIDQEDFILEVR